MRLERDASPLRQGSTVRWMILGLGLGFGGGFLLGALAGSITGNRVQRTLRRVRSRQTRQLDPIAAVREALATDRKLQSTPLRVTRVGHTGLELSGWVDSRQTRAHAYRTATRMAGGLRVVNAVLVQGEDDLPSHPTASPRAETSHPG